MRYSPRRGSFGQSKLEKFVESEPWLARQLPSKHGHYLVPSTITVQGINPGHWVTKQHTQIKNKLDVSSLTGDRMYALNGIGF